MTTPDYSWNTRLAVSYTDDQGTVHDIAPVTSFAPNFAATAEPQHSIGRTHVGVVHSPHSITFSLTVSAIGPSAAELTGLALNGTRFKITLQELVGNDWSFSTIVLDQCVLTSAAPTSATVSGAPQAQFSGFALRAEATATTGQKATSPQP
jgi:hypothetical protein